MGSAIRRLLQRVGTSALALVLVVSLGAGTAVSVQATSASGASKVTSTDVAGSAATEKAIIEPEAAPTGDSTGGNNGAGDSGENTDGSDSDGESDDSNPDKKSDAADSSGNGSVDDPGGTDDEEGPQKGSDESSSKESSGTDGSKEGGSESSPDEAPEDDNSTAGKVDDSTATKGGELSDVVVPVEETVVYALAVEDNLEANIMLIEDIGDEDGANEAYDANSVNNTDDDDDDTFDFGSCITDVTFTVSGKELESGTKVDDKDTIAVRISYTLPVGSIDSQNNVISYTLPAQLSAFEHSGVVQNASGATVGSYVIEDGVVTITFKPAFAGLNTSSTVEGTLWFDGKAELIDTGDQNKTEIKFNDKVKFEIEVTPDEKKKGDITVKKAATDIDESTGELTYTITVTSTYGTSSEVTLTDVMTDVLLKDGQFKVTDADDKTVSGWKCDPAAKAGDAGFTMTLPKMSAGSTYVVTYTGKLPEDLIGGTVTTKNKVTATSTNTDKETISSNASISKSTKGKIAKSGKDNKDGTITWTVTINEGEVDISGWTLNDVTTGGTGITGDITISPAPNTGSGSATIEKFPYTFPDDSAQVQYKVTYKTTYTKGYETQKIKNTATLSKDGQQSSEADKTITIGTLDAYDKSGTGATLSDDKSTVILGWKISITAAKDYEPGWVIKEKPESGQYFTAEQRTELIAALEDIFDEGTVTLSRTSTSDSEEFTENTDGSWTGLYITVNTALAQGTRFTFSFHTSVTAPVAGTDKVTYKNTMTFDDHDSTGSNDYTPPIGDRPYIEKWDEIDEEGGDETSHKKSELDSNKLKWMIRISIPAEDREAEYFTVTETLPDMTFIDKIERFRIWTEATGSGTNASFSNSNLKDGATSTKEITVNKQKVTLTAKRNGNTITLTLPKALYKYDGSTDEDAQIYLNVWLSLKTEGTNAEGTTVTWEENGIESFTNAVTIRDNSGTVKGTDSQTQKIRYDYYSDAVDKNGSARTDNSNILEYSVVVNKDGAKLLGESGANLTLTDVLTYTHNAKSGKMRVTLVPESVKVYLYDATAKKASEIELDSAQWTYQYTEHWETTGVIVGTDESAECTNTLTVQVPDGQALVVTYQYYVTGEEDKTAKTSNTATLSGNGVEYASGTKTLSMKVQNAGATANAKGINVYKVDADNNAVYLKGAQFRLEVWNSDQYDWIPVTKAMLAKWANPESASEDETVATFTTDALGHFATGSLQYNRAYRIIEIEAPEGHEISDGLKEGAGFEFYIVSNDTTTYPKEIPGNFTGQILTDAHTIYLSNPKGTPSYTLPETGGAGTLPITAAGLALIIVAGVMMRRRRYQ